MRTHAREDVHGVKRKRAPLPAKQRTKHTAAPATDGSGAREAGERLPLGVWPAGPTAPPISAPQEKIPQPPGLRNDTRTEGHLGVGVLRMQGRR